MRLAVIALALGLAASCALLPSRSLAASLEKGTVELETSVDFNHTNYSESAVGSRTNLDGTLGAGYSLTRLLQVGGGLLFGHHSGESDNSSFSYSSFGASGDLTANFTTPSNLVPFVRAGVGFESFSGDGFANAKAALTVPYLRGGVRVLVGNSGSVNLSVAYRHIIHADGEDQLDANVVSFAVGLSVFPWHAK